MNTVELASLYRTSDYKEQLVIKTTLLFNTTLLLRLLRTNMFLNAFFTVYLHISSLKFTSDISFEFTVNVTRTLTSGI